MGTEHRFIAFDETPIFYRRTLTDGPPRAIVLIVHGMGEHSGRYEHVTQSLKEAGLASYAFDLRGFGQSGGGRGSVRKARDFHEDIRGLHSLAMKNHPGVPIFFLGHSFGGLLSASYLTLFHERLPACGLILSSPIFGIAVPIPWWQKLLAAGCTYLSPNFVMQSRVDPAKLTHDSGFLEKYTQDPLIHHGVSARLYHELLALIRQKDAIAAQLELPTLLLQAELDFIVSKEASVDFFNKIRYSDKELKVCMGFYHEILNEMLRNDVITHLIQWVYSQIKHN